MRAPASWAVTPPLATDGSRPHAVTVPPRAPASPRAPATPGAACRAARHRVTAAAGGAPGDAGRAGSRRITRTERVPSAATAAW